MRQKGKGGEGGRKMGVQIGSEPYTPLSRFHGEQSLGLLLAMIEYGS